MLGVLGGALSALGPLLLAERGLGASGIAACFIAAGAPQVLLISALGRRPGRSGLVQFCVAMTLVSAVLLPLTTVPTGQLTTAVVFSVVLGVQWTTFTRGCCCSAPSPSAPTQVKELAMSLANGAWGLCATAGGLLLAKVAQATSIWVATSPQPDGCRHGHGPCCLVAHWVVLVDRSSTGSEREPGGPGSTN